MFSRLLLLFVCPAVLLTSCWVEEAPAPVKQELTIASDFLTKEDSLLINQFSFDKKVEIKIMILPKDSIKRLLERNAYNTGIDLLITQEKELRDFFYNKGAFRRISNDKLFQQVERQFDNKHHLWIGLSHDPLVVASPKDSLQSCPRIDFDTWHREDSLRADIKILKGKEEYLGFIGNNSSLSFLTDYKVSKGLSREIVLPLTELVDLESRNDTNYNRNLRPCFQYIIESKKYLSRTTTISQVKFSRNIVTADRFVNYFFSNSWSVANGRNQLPTVKRYKPNWYIESLFIHSN